MALLGKISACNSFGLGIPTSIMSGTTNPEMVTALLAWMNVHAQQMVLGQPIFLVGQIKIVSSEMMNAWSGLVTQVSICAQKLGMGVPSFPNTGGQVTDSPF
jgi:hypothetical protein